MATPTLHADTQVGSKRHTTSGWRHWPQQAWWPWLTRSVAIAFFAVVAALIFRQARTVDWPAVLQALRDLPTAALALGGALALLSHFTYGSFDWVGRHCSGHGSCLFRLSTRAILVGLRGQYRPKRASGSRLTRAKLSTLSLGKHDSDYVFISWFFFGSLMSCPTINSFVIKGIDFRLHPNSPSPSPTLSINHQGEICRFKP